MEACVALAHAYTGTLFTGSFPELPYKQDPNPIVNNCFDSHFMVTSNEGPLYTLVHISDTEPNTIIFFFISCFIYEGGRNRPFPF